LRYVIDIEKRNMRRALSSTQMRLYRAGILILLLGLGSALFIYFTTAPAPNDNAIDLFQYSKMYARDLELIGGKANVLADELFRWLGGLWHGKALAYTIAVISIAASVLLFLAARKLPGDPDSSQ
jgi:hypothetical protein